MNVDPGIKIDEVAVLSKRKLGAWLTGLIIHMI
jgi:hypothetical protein